MRHSQRREQLLDTAITLFARHGYHAVGIDTILKCAGVSKKTLYRHFRSKDELILAALRKYDGRFRNAFMRQVEARAAEPRGRLLAVFDVAADWFEADNFYGCMFVNAVGEYAEAETPIRRACRDFKAEMRRYIEDLCRQAGAPEPATLAAELALLLEGAIVTAQVSGQVSGRVSGPVAHAESGASGSRVAESRGRAAETAKSAAKVLIDQALAAGAGRP
ncbi:MAG: TetR/AcrR family transcriptional regulator [Alphaproteobacteria bacterium]